MNNNFSEIATTLKNAQTNINKKWDEEIIPILMEYIKIPNKSPAFDNQWHEHGYMDQAMQLIIQWCKSQDIQGMQLQLIQLPQRTPLLFIEIDGQINETILLYGHMDKQPEMSGWDDDLGPWKPVLKNGKLYGRGGADDGYAIFATLTAIKTLQQQKIPHSRCVIMIEACEESGSIDLPNYLQHLRPKIKTPSLIICLDSGCNNYQQLWSTTSLRGLISGELTIKVLREGIHSGIGSGIVPSAWTILREILDRIEDHPSGKIKIPELYVDIPAQRVEQAQQTGKFLGEKIIKSYPWHGETKPVTDNPAELILNRTWRPALSIIGIDGVPSVAAGGNVTLPEITVKCSIRTPPTLDVAEVTNTLKEILEKDPPFNATVSFQGQDSAPGWNAPELSDWLAQITDQASQCFYHKPAAYIGEGGSIPFMGMLSEIFPQAQFLITGVLGPKSNAHGPNEFLHIDMVKNITACIAFVIAGHCQHFS